MAYPELTATGVDSKGKYFKDTLKFDDTNRPIFDDFLSDGINLEHGIHLLYELARTSSMHDKVVLSILDEIAGKRLQYDNKVAIINGIVGTLLDMWSKKGPSNQINNILNKIKITQSELLEEALKNPNVNTRRIEEMDKVIKNLTERDARAAQIAKIEGRS